MILVAVGARPETEIAQAAGLPTGFKGALKVNQRMETPLPDIFAAGDCAEGSLGTQSVRLFEYVVARTGFHDRDAASAGFDPVSVDGTAWDHKVYYPGAKEMTIRITGDRSTGRLLGAQMIGRYGTEVSKRIDILAAAIHNGMTVEQLNDLDLSYTPPLSSPWDPVQIAAPAWRQARKPLSGWLDVNCSQIRPFSFSGSSIRLLGASPLEQQRYSRH